jgi:hypothetical protein
VEKLTFLYTLTRACREEVERDRKKFELAAPYWTRQNGNSLNDWVEAEVAKYDKYRELVRVTFLDTTTGCVSFAVGEKENPTEADLLRQVWAFLHSVTFGGNKLVAGWEIYSKITPLLLNRSIKYGLEIPYWIRPDVTKKWGAGGLFDVAQVYYCGVYPSVRPLPDLGEALGFWLGRPFPLEADTRLFADQNPLHPDLTTTTCDYVQGMATVVSRFYLTRQYAVGGAILEG